MAKTPGLGLLLPVRGGPEGYFWTSYKAIDQIKSNLTNLILTIRGERVMQPTFGCSIHNLVFDHITDDLKANATGAIKEAVATWMPFLSIDDVKLQKDEDHNKIYIEVRFTLISMRNLTDSITVVI